MKTLAAFIARKARTNADGTFDVEGAGILAFRPAGAVIVGAPIRLPFSYVARLELDRREADQMRSFDVQVVHEGRPVRLNSRGPIAMRTDPAEDRYYLNLVLGFMLEVDRPGRGYVEASFNGGKFRVPRVHYQVSL